MQAIGNDVLKVKKMTKHFSNWGNIINEEYTFDYSNSSCEVARIVGNERREKVVVDIFLGAGFYMLGLKEFLDDSGHDW